MQTRDVVEGLQILPTLRVLRLGYVNTEKVLYYFYKIIMRNTRKSETSQQCLHTLI